ncbi:hypothetical protein LguiA_031431 [Lonicera macranthoides]
MVDFEFKAIARRIRKCALDLLSLGGDLIDEDDNYESWDLIQKDLRLKSTFLFCDLNKMINSAARDHKNALTELSNKFFCSIEEVDHAVKVRSIELTQDRCSDAAVIFREIMELLVSSSA